MNQRSDLYGLVITGSLIASVVAGSLGPLIATLVVVFALEFLLNLAAGD